jgi:FlaA1/EpsC-like NDP-sugar epimerase
VDKNSNTEFVAVGYGNVLNSNGPVIPLFKKQIDNSGPVTVTNKYLTRYFVTIPEASQLVLQAGAYAVGGEIFVLDMDKPVKIYDLACNLIRLSGFELNKDVMVEITGLKPGEKLFEESPMFSNLEVLKRILVELRLLIENER